jgi:hypothetical protein
MAEATSSAKRKRKRTVYTPGQFPHCVDCQGPTLDWWAARSGYENAGGAVRRCESCYLAYCRELYHRRRRAAGFQPRPKADPNKKHKRQPRRRTCRICSVEYVVGDGWSNGFHCSDSCVTRAKSDRNRRKNVKRRTARREAPSSYTLHQVAERDGWRCHICRKRVDQRLSGTHKLGPTIDHLIPLSDGGSDDMQNVALAHRSCNCARGVGGVVQLMLIG